MPGINGVVGGSRRQVDAGGKALGIGIAVDIVIIPLVLQGKCTIGRKG